MMNTRRVHSLLRTDAVINDYHRVSTTIVMMREPPGLPSTRKILPSLVTSEGDNKDSDRLPGAIKPAPEPAQLDGEVIHFVVEKEAGAAPKKPFIV
jgi:hypothetical protein